MVLHREVDLLTLVQTLSRSLSATELTGYLQGKSLMRDALVREHGFSELEAEELIDTLELQGFLRFLGDPAEQTHDDAPWRLRIGTDPTRHLDPTRYSKISQPNRGRL